MNVWQLKVFTTVAKVRTLSGAARLLYLSQPAVSAQVFSLERQFDTRLLQRHRHGVTLTPAGRVLYDYAIRVLALLEEMEKAVVAADREGRLCLAVSRQAERAEVAAAVREFLAANPTVDVQMLVLPARDVLAGVRCGRFDLGIVGSAENHEAGGQTAGPRPATWPKLPEAPVSVGGGRDGLRLVWCGNGGSGPARQLMDYLTGETA